jgi:hypothetical protein
MREQVHQLKDEYINSQENAEDFEMKAKACVDSAAYADEEIRVDIEMR